MVNFLLVLIEFFSPALTVEALSGIGRNRVRKRMGHFDRKFQGNGALPTNDCWRRKTRVPGLSRESTFNRFGIVPVCDRRSDRRTQQ